MLAEQAAEIERIVIPHGICDLANGIIRVLQKALGVGKTQLQDVLQRTGTGDLPEALEEPAGTEPTGGGIFGNVDLLRIVLLKKVHGTVNLPHAGIAVLFLTSQLPPHADQQTLEQQRRKHLIVRPAQLQLLNHLPEEPQIVRRRANGKNALRRIQMTAFQKRIRLAAGKMHPVDFRLLRLIIDIFLWLVRDIEHGSAGGENVLRAIDPEVSLSGGKVQKLVILSPAGAVRHDLRTASQPVVAATGDQQRPALVHQRKLGIMEVGGVDKHLDSSPFLCFLRYYQYTTFSTANQAFCA